MDNTSLPMAKHGRAFDSESTLRLLDFLCIRTHIIISAALARDRARGFRKGLTGLRPFPEQLFCFQEIIARQSGNTPAGNPDAHV